MISLSARTGLANRGMKFHLKRCRGGGEGGRLGGDRKKDRERSELGKKRSTNLTLDGDSTSDSDDDFAANIAKKRQRAEKQMEKAEEKFEELMNESQDHTKGAELPVPDITDHQSKYMEDILRAKKQRDQDEAENHQMLLDKQLEQNSRIVVFESPKYRALMAPGVSGPKVREAADTFGLRTAAVARGESPKHKQDPITKHRDLSKVVEWMIAPKITGTELQAYKQRYFQRKT